MFNRFFYDNYIFNNITLDKYQTKAVFCNHKSYLVVAGAGSGKTLTIVGKVHYLINIRKINPKNILCLSFTNETVNSLKEAFNKNDISVDVKTFHKFSLEIISRKNKIAPSGLLDYITEEFFYSYIYFDNTYKLLELYLEDNHTDYQENLNYLKNMIISFIHTFKSYNYDMNYLLKLIFSVESFQDKILLIIIFKIYILYQEELSSQMLIDFDDIINFAAIDIDKLHIFKYQYIIIDEYQDTSLSKYKLIKNICNKFQINLMAVGDDFQSIYAFTGCNLNLFLNFKKNFEDSKIIKLKNTYRNPKDIVDISNRFVLKNKKQMKKRLKSSKYIKNSIIIVYSLKTIEALAKIISDIDNILILGRNNCDINVILDNKTFQLNNGKIIFLKNPNKSIRFLTVHCSKGLESDYVVLLNVVDSYFGFPNKIIEPDIFQYIHKDFNHDFWFAEERRLFYVALTRTKNKIYLFTNKNNPSIFIKELIKNYNWKIKKIDFE